MDAAYIFPTRAAFENVAAATAAGAESDVNGLWCSRILQTYFPYQSAQTYVMKPEFIQGGKYDILVTRQNIANNKVTWTWVLIYEGKKNGATWDDVRGQVTTYFRTSGHPKLYGIGAIGRKCKFWEWHSSHLDKEYQLQINVKGEVVPKDGQFSESDIITNDLDVEKYIQFIKAEMLLVRFTIIFWSDMILTWQCQIEGG